MSRRTPAVAIVVAVIGAACARPQSAEPRAVVDTAVITAGRTSLPAFYAAAGTVRPHAASILGAGAAGTVVSIRAREGDHVRAGTVLVEIDPREPRARVERARSSREETERAIDAATAAAQLADATARRYAALHERGSVSELQFDETRTRATAARAELAMLVARRDEARAGAAEAGAALEKNSVRAPYDGVIVARFVDPGAQAAPGMPLLQMEDERAAEVDASVPGDVVVHAGDTVQVASAGRTVDARVIRVQPSLDTSSRTSLVRLALAEPMRSGIYVKVLVPTGSRSAVTVPVASLVQRGQLTSVFVVGADRVARMRLITIGEVAGANAEVLSGIEAGESIVKVPAAVREGVTVRNGS